MGLFLSPLSFWCNSRWLWRQASGDLVKRRIHLRREWALRRPRPLITGDKLIAAERRRGREWRGPYMVPSLQGWAKDLTVSWESHLVMLDTAKEPVE